MRVGRIVVLLAVAGLLAGCQDQPMAPSEDSPEVLLLANTGVLDGSVYELVVTPLDWKSAKKAARRMVAPGCKVAHLATITSAEEQAVVSGLMAGSESNAWIGGRQGGLSLKENWHWITGERWVYTSWDPNEPNDDAGPGSEQHLETLTGDRDGVWNDAPGFEEKFFVVESEHCN